MRWLLAGYCGLALINISVCSVVLSNALTQKPRFYGVRTSRSVRIACLSSKHDLAATVKWYKTGVYDGEREREIKAGQRFQFRSLDRMQGAELHIQDLQLEDKGVYFCRVNGTWGPGTQLQVSRPFNQVQATHRTKMKDALIILQALLLAVCIAAMLLRKRNLMEKRDSIYEEPETDHIYEGLTIETCGGGLYEELSVYAQAEGTEAPWE